MPILRLKNHNCNEKRIMKLNRMLVLGAAAVFCVGITQTCLSQQDNGGPPPGRRNFDPAQFRQRMMDRLREQLEVTDDSEWKAMEPLVQNVMDARMAAMSGGGMRGMFGGPRRRTADNGGAAAEPPRRGPFGQPPSAEAETLQKAIDAKAPKAEVKAALEKYVAYRKAKQAELERAQDELRKVLTTRQEAIATLDGLL